MSQALNLEFKVHYWVCSYVLHVPGIVLDLITIKILFVLAYYMRSFPIFTLMFPTSVLRIFNFHGLLDTTPLSHTPAVNQPKDFECKRCETYSVAKLKTVI
jgi:hypothetical protein